MTRLPRERVLIYDRIGANSRNTRLLLAVFALLLLPVAAYFAIYVMLWVGLILAMALAGSGMADALSGDEGSLIAFAVVDAVISVLIVVAVAYLQFRFAAAVVLRLAGARPLGRDEEPELRRAVENLCIGAGLARPRLFVVEAQGANAFSTGLEPKRAALVVTRGLVKLLDRRELEAVLAHELVQIGSYDTRLATVLAAGVMLLWLPLAIVRGFFRLLFRIHWALGWGVLLYLGLPILGSIPFGIAVADDFLREDLLAGIIFIFSMALPVYLFLLAPTFAYLIRTAVLRQRELLADADAALLTRDPEGLARALVKMSAAGGRGRSVAASTAHLYVVDPLLENPSWWDRLISSHLPIGRRVEVLGAMAGGIPPSVLERAQAAAVAGAAVTAGAVDESLVEPPSGAEGAEDGARRVAFRLTGTGATVYERPDATSGALVHLPAGALVTVFEDHGEFLQVITPDDRFGFISRSAPMVAFDPGEQHGER